VSFGEENRRTLAACHPGVLRALELAGDTQGEVRLIPTPSGAPTVLRDGLSFHSRHDPRIEAERQVAADIDAETTAVLIFGFGLGYAAEAVRRRFPLLPILILEPDAGMFRTAMESRDLTALFSDTRIAFLAAAEPEAVTTLLGALPLGKPAFLRLRPAAQVRPGWFRAVEEIIRSWMLRREINLNTLNRFGRLWVRNLARNMHSFVEAPGISRLAGLADGLPALVIAGGPSLDALFPLLPSLRERMVVISVNTPLKRCIQAGVEPDFVVVVDPQYWASRFMDWIEPESRKPGAQGQRIIVAEPSTHPRLLRDSARPDARGSGPSLYLCSSLFPLGESLEAAVGEKGKLGAGGSVATAAWDLARHLGARPIYMAGLDLGYPAMRTHCRGVFTEDLWLAACHRTVPQEMSSFRYLHEIGLFPVRSSGGAATPTDRRMLLYKWWFENQLAMHSEARTFTLSPDSVAIEGMPLADVQDTLRLPRVRDEIEARMRKEREGAALETSAAGRAPHLRRALRELLRGLDELQTLARRALAANEALGKALRPGKESRKTSGRLLAELDEVDARILSISERGIAGFLLQSLIHGIEGKGDRTASREEALADGAALYRGILDSASWQKGIIGKALASLPPEGAWEGVLS
jgi:hypothetical protein